MTRSKGRVRRANAPRVSCGRRALPVLLLAMLLPAALRAEEGGPYRDPALEAAALFRADSLAAAPALKEDRWVAIGLAVALGPFGAHRLYLGTSPGAAIFYGLTFGGFGALVLIDLAHLILAKDLEPYRNNRRVLMWAEPAAGKATPP